jgi:hypothetical protein
MLRLLSDENFDDRVVQGVLRRLPGLDLVRVLDVGLRQTADPVVLEWAAGEDRILVTHDESNIPTHARARINAGLIMPGVFLVPDELPIRDAIEAICLVAVASEQAEWRHRIEYLPLR